MAVGAVEGDGCDGAGVGNFNHGNQMRNP
jgi:hypothetical protein